MAADIRFPHLGISIPSVGKSISVFGFSIAYYGIVIAFGMICGFLMAEWQAKRMDQDREVILDLALWDIIFALVGARIYFVVFSWDYYKDHLTEIFNTRGGGMAIYGGVIAGVITTLVFSKIRKVSFLKLADVAVGGLLVGQIFGRWGNFFNREAFGSYTDSLFAMQIKRADVRESDITPDILQHLVSIKGTEYIQVHPTFLYELLWNIGVLTVILLYTRHRKFDGQIFLMYLFGYGLGRFWIEGLRTDQLTFTTMHLPVSQVLSLLLVLVSGGILLYQFIKRKRRL